MRYIAGLLLLLGMVGCDTTTHAPDLNSVQPSVQQVEQDKLNQALQ